MNHRTLVPLSRTNGVLHFNGIPIPTLGAFAGTPVYVYSWDRIVQNVEHITQQLGDIHHQVHYAVKANSNLTILRRLAHLDIGFDIVSVGELERVLRVGGCPNKIMYSGVGKTTEELAFALKVGIGSINIESAGELQRVTALAKRLQVQANVMFRINPNVDATTHPYLATALDSSKFGLTSDEVIELLTSDRKIEELNVIGLSCHLGSQISAVAHFEVALNQLIVCADVLECAGLSIKVFNLGGGFATRYKDEQRFSFGDLAAMLRKQLRGREVEIRIEPGRTIVADAGILITRVEYLKRAYLSNGQNFAVVDAAINDLIRPALYNSWHHIVSTSNRKKTPSQWDIVGPICESSDVLGRNRSLALAEGDLLVIEDVGAYGSALSSNYNSRMRSAELLITPDDVQIIRRRESMADVLSLEERT